MALLETPKQCAERVGVVKERTIRELIRRGEIEHVRIAGRVYLTDGAWEALIERRKVRPCQEGTADHTCNGAKIEPSITSCGPSEAAAASAALARLTLNTLKSSLQSGSQPGGSELGQVIRLKHL
jgi:excisionase family DNA binding protein